MDGRPTDNKKRRHGKFNFLALKGEIAEKVESGLPISFIWEELTSSKKLSLSYPQFCRYVNRYITKKASKSVEKQQEDDKSSSQVSTNESNIRSYNHKPKPDKDLI